MPSSFERIRPATGGGNSRDDGHHDATVMVIQRETTGARLDPETQRVNPPTIQAAKDAAVPPPGLGLQLDNYRVERYGTTDSALLWTFQYSNDNWFNLGQIAGGDLSIPNGNFNSNPVARQFTYPALIKYQLAIPTGLGPPDVKTWYTRFTLPTEQESLRSWKVKTTTDVWSPIIEAAIGARVGTIHLIGGTFFKFNGVSSLRQLGPNSYEVIYEWFLDFGLRDLAVVDAQDADYRLILPPKVPALVEGSPNPVLSKGFGPPFAGDTYVRLPYHAVTLGQAADIEEPPPFVQFVTATFDANLADDWIDLPGDPINAAGGG